MAPGIIINSYSHKPGSKEYDFYANDGYREYLEDKKQHTKDDVNQKKFIKNQPIIHKSTYNDYLSRSGAFKGKGGDEYLPLWNKRNEEYNSRSREANVAEGSVVYSVVVSLNNETTEKNDIDIACAKEIAKKTFNSLIVNNKKWGFDSRYFDYDAVLHKNTDNDHIHMRIYQPHWVPKEKIVDRLKLSLYGFNQAKFVIANDLEGLKEDKAIFSSKKDLEQSFINKHKQTIKTLSEIEIKKQADKDLAEKFYSLKKQQGIVFKLFKNQPNKYYFIDKNTNEKVNKQGLSLTYDNLNNPVYSLKDLLAVKNGTKSLVDCKKTIQPEQIAYKKMIDKYIESVIDYDYSLNKENKKFNQFCEEYKNERFNLLGGNELKQKNADSMRSVINNNTQHRIFNDMQKNMGNSVIKSVTSAISSNLKFKKASPRKINKIKSNCYGNVQHYFHQCFSNHTNSSISMLKMIDNSFLTEQIRKEKQKAKLESMAQKQNITVEELIKKLEDEKNGNR